MEKGGKYDELCIAMRDATAAECAIVIILGGELGSGFSVAATEHGLHVDIPALLEKLAREIRAAQWQGTRHDPVQ